MIIGFIFLLLMLCVSLYYIYRLRHNQLTNLDLDIIEKQKRDKELEKEIAEKNSELISLSETARTTQNSLVSDYEHMENMLMDAMLSTIDRFRADQIKLSEQQYQEKRQKSEELYTKAIKILEEEQNKLQNELEEDKNKIEKMKQTIEIANKAIMANRMEQEKQDFHRICLSEESIADIASLRAIRPNLNHRENLDKMIYDNYVAKPTLEMIKRVLGGRVLSGIYKITRLKTQEVYIGKSTDVKSRWQQHVKSAFNCGTIASSILHRTMEKDGIENFTFELIEEAPKDRLGELEKFWIDFYGAKQYGLNEKAGG